MKTLILGANGYLGKVLFSKCNALKEMFIYGTYFNNPSNGLFFLNILDKEATRKVIDSFAPDIVVWCLCSAEHEIELSNIGLRNILSLVNPSVRFIYISSTLSQKENQNEETLSELRTEEMYLANYINGKILGEELVQSHKNYVIIRPGQIYGFGQDGAIDIRMQRIKNHVKENGNMIRSANAFVSVIHVNDLVSCIIELFYSDYTGILCVASEKAVSYYEFYTFLARQIGIDEEKILPEYSNTLSTYFDTSKARSIIKTPMRNLDLHL